GVGSSDEIVQFSATLGTLDPTSALTDVNGSTSVLLTSTDTQLGAATITAVVASKSLNASKNYQLIGSTSSSTLTLSTRNADCVDAANSFSAGSTFCLVAEMRDENGPVANQIITFTSPIGVLSQTTALTNAQGLATALVVSSSTQLGAATAVADHANLNATANYEFITGGSTTSLEPRFTLATIQNGVFQNSFKAGESIQLQARLLDSDGLRIEPQTIVRFSVERGQLNTSSALTSAATGYAEVTLTSQTTDIGAAVATVQADVDGVTYTQTFNYEILSADAVEDVIPSIGYFNDANEFIKNEINLSITPDANGKYNLSAGGTMGLSILVVNQNNERIITPTPVTFSSACADNNSANLDTLVTTINGQAQSTYEDVSCATVNGNQDTLTASVTINNVSLTATATIELLAEDVGSIEFISAEPTNIVLKGTGGQGKQETSTLTFSIKGVLGNALTQQKVTFSLDTDVGGLSISPLESLTNSQGLVTTKVTSGNVPAAVRVTATTVVGQDPDTNEDIVIRTQSDLLSVNTGLPDQNSITLTTATINPEAHNTTGVEVILTAFMADSFNNPVPDGTTVNFTTEGGFIQPTCNTTNGSCNVTWTGTNPRVPNHRITVLATAIGHETFFDFNGNNVFDDADGVAISEGTDSGLNRGNYFASGFIDHSEAWRDDDEDRAHDDGELFIDYNNDQTFNSADGLFNGPHCTHATLCGAQAASKINVRKAIVMIMSGSSPVFTLMTSSRTATSNTAIDHIGTNYVLNSNDTETGVTIDGGVSVATDGTVTADNSGIITLEEGHSLQMVITAADDAVGLGQILPAGTIVTISTSFGGISGASSFTIPNSTGYLNSTGADQYGGTGASFSLVNTNSTNTTGDTTQSGLLTFTFTMPSSNLTVSYTMPFTMIGH
ncbi:MAG: hypothetical protein MJK04_21060, partial [Psychrosphaera sp.]|nr:hypothetical protein [Psychrosphaera sp.]